MDAAAAVFKQDATEAAKLLYPFDVQLIKDNFPNDTAAAPILLAGLDARALSGAVAGALGYIICGLALGELAESSTMCPYSYHLNVSTDPLADKTPFMSLNTHGYISGIGYQLNSWPSILATIILLLYSTFVILYVVIVLWSGTISKG